MFTKCSLCTLLVSQSVQLLSRIWLFETPWIAVCQASLSITNSQSLPKPMSIESVILSNHLIFSHPLLFLPSIFPSIRVFSNESALRIKWLTYWSLNLNISPSNEHPGLIFFMMDGLNPLAVQETLKSLLQHHSSKSSILQHSAFFIVQLSYPYMTTGKTIALTRQTFVGKITSLLFNMLSQVSSVQFSHSVVSDSLWPHELQHASLPVHHQLPEFTQTHIHRVSDAIQPSHPLSSPSPPAPNPSQHQSIFLWVNSSHEVAKVLEFQL